MLQPKSRPTEPSLMPPDMAAAERFAWRPFFNTIDCLIVDDPTTFKFTGAISRAEAEAVWIWLVRDLAPDLIDSDSDAVGPTAVAALQAITPALLQRAAHVVQGADADREAERRLRGQLGGSEIWQRLPAVLTALKCAPLLEKAQDFGRAVNALPDEAAIATALQSMPWQDADIASGLMMATMGQVTNPTRIIVAATHIAGEATEGALLRAGLAPLVDALLARAQNTIPPLLQAGAFTDMDLICRSIDRFHQLARALYGNVELSRPGRWAPILAALTTAVSDRLQPKLRDLVPDLNQSLRRQRDGADWLDGDSLLAALGGFYLLEAVRECRDSLALNELFEETWSRTGQSLEMHLTRNLDDLRDNPNDPIVAARVDGGIKMAELRFGADYAQVIRQARDGVGPRAVASG